MKPSQAFQLPLIFAVFALLAASAPGYAQDTPAVSGEPAPAPVAGMSVVKVNPDTELMKRTPVVDGIVENGEWDGFYAVSEPGMNATTYANWDDTYLYFAVKSDQPVDLLVLIDANDDGWFHGEENYEILASPSPDVVGGKRVLRFLSRSSVSAQPDAVTEAEAAIVDVKTGSTNGSYFVEVRFPKNMIRDFKLAEGKKLGVQIGVKRSSVADGWIPSEVAGDKRQCFECMPVTKKNAQLTPLSVGFDLRDSVVARGEDLVGRFHLANNGAETVYVRNYVIAGEGKAGPYLNSYRFRIEGMSPKRRISEDFRTTIPSDMPLGCWVMGAEVRTQDARAAAALMTFQVVDTFETEMQGPSGDVPADAKTVGVKVVVHNNARKPIRGTVKIVYPLGWEVWKGADTKEFNIVSGRAVTAVEFAAKPPLGVAGTVVVRADVSVDGATKSVETSFNVVRK